MFAERTKEGVYKQQDADECFQNMVTYLEKIALTVDQEGDKVNLVKNLFEIEFEIQYFSFKKHEIFYLFF